MNTPCEGPRHLDDVTAQMPVIRSIPRHARLDTGELRQQRRQLPPVPPRPQAPTAVTPTRKWWQFWK